MPRKRNKNALKIMLKSNKRKTLKSQLLAEDGRVTQRKRFYASSRPFES